MNPFAFVPTRLVAATAFVVVATMMGGVVEAQSLNGRNRIMNNFDRPAMQALRRFLNSPTNPETPVPPIDFKVPSEAVVMTVCEMRITGLNCRNEVLRQICPNHVEVRLPDGSSTSMLVNCTGPDAEGLCDCEFLEAG